MATKRAKKQTRRTKLRPKTRSNERTIARVKGRAKMSRPAGGDSLDQFIDAAARELALPVEPGWKPAVRFNLEVTLRAAALFTEFPLPDAAEPAPVFVA
jgi:1-carboxybiuret hydrolase subunit AtzG-like